MSNAFIDPSLLGPAGSSAAAPAGGAAGQQQPEASTSTEAARKADEAKKADERARKDRTLVDFMEMLDGYEPVVRLPLAPCCLQLAS